LGDKTPDENSPDEQKIVHPELDSFHWLIFGNVCADGYDDIHRDMSLQILILSPQRGKVL
jgi:hypothetical protein